VSDYRAQVHLAVGMSVERRIQIETSDVRTFGLLVRDRNPLHFDADAAKAAGFSGVIVHGMLAASFFSGLLGSELPGTGTVYLGQSLRFECPVPVGEEVTFRITVKAVRQDKPIVTLETACILADGTVAIRGEAVVKVPRERVA